MSIRVGQIYKGKEWVGEVLVITKTHKFGQQELYDYIYQDGSAVAQDYDMDIELGRKLIAEYPTWQEAVNSKEFNNGN